jgi:hypothetical protein
MKEQQMQIVALLSKVDALSNLVLDFQQRTERSTEIGLLHDRMARLEVLTVCSPMLDPSVEEVLSQALAKKTSTRSAHPVTPQRLTEPEVEESPVKTVNFDIYSDAGDDEKKHVPKALGGDTWDLDRCYAYGQDKQTASWEQLPQTAWHHIYEKFIEKEDSKELEDKKKDNQLVEVAQTVLDDSPIEKNELVLCNGEIVTVIRIGFGEYFGRLRICRQDENHKSWGSGTWVGSDRCTPIRAPMKLRVKERFWSANEDSVHLEIGQIGSLCAYDKDGDLEIRFEGIQRTQFVLAEDVVFIAVA